MADLPAEFWVLRSTPHPSYFIVQSVLPPVQQNAVVVAGPFQTQAEAQTWIDNHSGPGPNPTGTQWYVKWSHTGSSDASGWTGAVDGPFPYNEAPTQSVITIAGKSYSLISGPFKTQAEAAAYIKSHPHGPPSESSTNIKLPTVPNPFAFLGWLQGVQHWLGIFVAAITDVHTWISVGWALLGLIFLVTGLIIWLRGTELGKSFGPALGAAAAA